MRACSGTEPRLAGALPGCSKAQPQGGAGAHRTRYPVATERTARRNPPSGCPGAPDPPCVGAPESSTHGSKRLIRTSKALTHGSKRLIRTSKALTHGSKRLIRTSKALTHGSKRLIRTSKALTRGSKRLIRTSKALTRGSKRLICTSKALTRGSKRLICTPEPLTHGSIGRNRSSVRAIRSPIDKSHACGARVGAWIDRRAAGERPQSAARAPAGTRSGFSAALRGEEQAMRRAHRALRCAGHR